MFNAMIRVLVFLRAAIQYAVLGGLAFTAFPVLAHHSSAMFDGGKVLTRQAVVRVMEFTNPHATLWIYVDNDKGEAELWALESLSPVILTRLGLTKDIIKPGDKVTVELSPLRDGRNGGQLRKIILADGRTLSADAPISSSETSTLAPDSSSPPKY